MNTASVTLTPDWESCCVEHSTDSSPSTTRDADAIVGTNYPWITSNMEGHYGAGPAIKAEDVSTRGGHR